MRKYTAAEVLAAVDKIGRPATTTEIAEQARETAGEPVWADRGVGNADVTGTLQALTDTGALVTARAAPRHRTVEAGEHDHIVPAGATPGHRVYATPAVSKSWRALLDTVAADNRVAYVLAPAVARDLATAMRTDRVFGEVEVDIDDHTERGPVVHLSLDLAALRHLAARLGVPVPGAPA